jgi:hypothetical protein
MSIIEDTILRFFLVVLSLGGSIVSGMLAEHQLVGCAGPASVILAFHILAGSVAAVICLWLASLAAACAAAPRRHAIGLKEIRGW